MQQVSPKLIFVTDQGLLFGNEGLKATVFKDGKLQLLLKLMGAERVGGRGISPQA
jgi:hypothetical protein